MRRTRSKKAPKETSATAPAPPAARPRWPAGLRWLGVGLAASLLLAGGLAANWWLVIPDHVRPHYVGRNSCLQCHADQGKLWHGSHHDLAMQVAEPGSVLGNFENAELTHHGVTSTMFRRDGKYMIHTEGPDGKLADFEIKYCFGVDPLQQYLVEFDPPPSAGPNEVGRLQVLRVSWDTHKQQWFHLSPPDVDEKLDPQDDLHWTGIAQRWNNMCAECHSTNLQKNFDAKSATYRTTFSEIDVSCEACHGPGSLHVQMARSFSPFWDRKRGYGLAKLKGDDAQPQIETCGQCHSRRRVLETHYAGGLGYFDHFGTELPNPMTYFADGQILDEVYVMGSFLQSKMYHKNIRCTDCHDPHSVKLKYEGNQLCTSCHQHPAAKYDVPSHHRHRPDSKGAACVECHMPETTYMDVDPRRDHSLRIPRPDLSVAHGLPNACTRCHLERSQLPETKRAGLKQYRDWVVAAQADSEIREDLKRIDEWCLEAVRAWYPAKTGELKHFGELLAPAWREQPDAVQSVLQACQQANYPAIIRATGWHWLRQAATPEVLAAAERALQDPHPLVRAAAAQVFESVIPNRDDLAEVPPEQRAAIANGLAGRIAPILPLLEDPVRLVRIDAASVLGQIPHDLLPAVTSGPQRAALASAKQELTTSLLANNDRAGAHVALGVLLENEDQYERALEAYRTAIRVEPLAAGPRSNLASAVERRVRTLRNQIQQAVAMGDRQHAEKLVEDIVPLELEIAQYRREELDLLRRDARLVPGNADVQYRLGLALYLNGLHAEAADSLKNALRLEPQSPRCLLMLALLYQKMEQYDVAIGYAQQLLAIVPDDRSYQLMLEQLREQSRNAPQR